MASRRLAALERLIEQWAAVGEGAGLQDSMGLAVCVAAMSFGIRHRVQHRGVAAVPHSADFEVVNASRSARAQPDEGRARGGAPSMKAAAHAKDGLVLAAGCILHASLWTAGASLGTSDAQLLRAHVCVGAVADVAYQPKALGAARLTDQMRGCVREEDRARFRMTHTCVGPARASSVRVPCIRNARDMCQSEYAVSLIHHVRPLFRREPHGIRKFRDPRFRPWAVSDRATIDS